MLGLKRSLRFKSVSLTLKLFNKKEKSKLAAVVIAQTLLGFMDLIGVGLLGLLGTLAVTGVQSLPSSGKVVTLLKFIHIDGLEFQYQVACVGALAGIVLAFKTVVSLLITRRNLFFLSRKSAEISVRLLERILSQSLLELRERTSQQHLYSIGQGVSTVVMGILGALIGMIADTSLLIILFSGLLIVDYVSAIASMLFFGLIGYILYKIMNVRVRDISESIVDTQIKINERVLEVMLSYREMIVRNRKKHYLEEIGKTRLSLARLEGEINFMPNISKYIVDLSLVLGALAISGFQFASRDAKHAIGSLLVFLVAGMRIGPAVMRLQQQIIGLRNSTAAASSTLELINRMFSAENVPAETILNYGAQRPLLTFSPKIKLREVSFTYPNSNIPALNNINLDISEYSFCAIVGPSGSGKTTMVDLILGMFPASHGNIEISNSSPTEVFSSFPGIVAYVPQDVIIHNSTILENIALGFTSDEINEERAWEALRAANLDLFVRGLPNAIYSRVGERGASLSGGQRQRLGIARALYTSPQIIVLDEATSALDGESEANITSELLALKGKVTLLMIAHRLSSIRDADKVVYLEKGTIRAIGKFDEVRKSVPEFNLQAEFMGL